jgi:hypothetical protein
MADERLSFAAVIASLLQDWGKFGRFILLIFTLFLIVLVFVWLALRGVPKNTTEVELGSVTLLSQPTRNGSRYLVIVSPQGWQETAIQLKENDTLSFEAGGKVYFDLEGLVRSLDERQKAEERVIEHEKKLGRWEAEKSHFLPEHYFTQRERALITPPWHWTDPNGDPATGGLANLYRKEKAIMKDRNYGALLGAIRETGAEPKRDDAFFVGRSNTIKAKQSGKLYFIVNDVWDDDDAAFPNKFFIDNIGDFYVKVTVEPPP